MTTPRPRFATRTAAGYVHGARSGYFTTTPVQTFATRDLAYRAGIMAVGAGNFTIEQV